jgi:uncharacterized membrane protein
LHLFDLRAALLAKHAQHVVLIHFPIALFILGVGFDFAAQATKRAALVSVAYYNLQAAAFCTLPTVATGFLAWQWQLEGQQLKGVLLLHLIFGCSSACLILLAGWLHAVAHRKKKPLPVFRLPLETLSVLVVGLTGHLAGFLSGVNGR